MRLRPQPAALTRAWRFWSSSGNLASDSQSELTWRFQTVNGRSNLWGSTNHKGTLSSFSLFDATGDASLQAIFLKARVSSNREDCGAPRNLTVQQSSPQDT